MSDNEDLGLTINKAYAEKYEAWRRKEELQKLKDRHGDVNAFTEDSDKSSSSESEDEVAEELTPKVEASWLKTLAALKAKDPKIYQKETIFFESEGSNEDSGASRQKKSRDAKPFTIKDYERKLILEKEGKYVDDDDSDGAEKGVLSKGYYDEQEELRRSIKAAAGVDDEDDSDGELLAVRTKTAAEEEEEEAAYHKWLMGQKSSLPEDEAQELEPLRQHCQKSDENEKFLWDYLLNKRYISKDEEEESASGEVKKDDLDLSEEEEILDQQETFERKYNFRFEEPDPDFIKNYPRTIDDSVRWKDTRRADKRKENKERKEQEKDRVRQELKRLKNLKRKELLDKINRLKTVSGHGKLNISERELDEDFDPAKHDAQMRANFGADYYGAGGEELKPTFDYDPELDGEDWDAWAGPSTADRGEQSAVLDNGTDAAPDASQPTTVHMDADFAQLEASPDTGRRKKKRRGRGSKFADSLSADKPPFDPDDKTFEEYVNEYYKFDYEDIIGDMPVRFKYRTVLANDFGLTVEEVLAAREKELNAWCSLKKAVQCRTEEEELKDQRMYAKRARDMEKKKKLLPSIVPLLEGSSSRLAASRPGDPASRSAAVDGDLETAPDTESAAGHETQKKKRRRRKKKDHGTRQTASIVEVEGAMPTPSLSPRLFAHGKSPKKAAASNAVDKAATSSVSAAGGAAVKAGDAAVEAGDAAVKAGAKKKPKKRKYTPDVISDERLKAYGFNPKKFKYLAKSKKSASS